MAVALAGRNHTAGISNGLSALYDRAGNFGRVMAVAMARPMPE
jgi:hypothetical protein